MIVGVTVLLLIHVNTYLSYLVWPLILYCSGVACPEAYITVCAVFVLKDDKIDNISLSHFHSSIVLLFH